MITKSSNTLTILPLKFLSITMRPQNLVFHIDYVYMFLPMQMVDKEFDRLTWACYLLKIATSAKTFPISKLTVENATGKPNSPLQD